MADVAQVQNSGHISVTEPSTAVATHSSRYSFDLKGFKGVAIHSYIRTCVSASSILLIRERCTTKPAAKTKQMYQTVQSCTVSPHPTSSPLPPMPAQHTHLVKVNHEGGERDGHSLPCVDAGEDGVQHTNLGRLGRHKTANVCQKHNQSNLQRMGREASLRLSSDI